MPENEFDQDVNRILVENAVEPTIENQNQNKITNNQKIIVITLVVFAFFTLFYGFFQMKKILTSPFASTTEETSGTVAQAEDTIDPTLDTDKDGLTDINELNVYNTSPYLEDTDGDGINDGEEVTRGTDPNCPEGRNCLNNPIDAVETASSTGDIAAEVETNYLNVSSSTSGQNMNSLLSGTVSADELRKMLLDSGMDKESLDKISDEVLISTYQESLPENK